MRRLRRRLCGLARVLLVTLISVASVTAVLLPGGYLDEAVPQAASVATLVAGISAKQVMAAPARAPATDAAMQGMSMSNAARGSN